MTDTHFTFGSDPSMAAGRLALGCWAFADEGAWGHQDRAESIATMHAALDAGINFFDTAPAYGAGASEELVGEAVRDRRERVLLATKVGRADFGPGGLARSCEQSLRRLKTDYIDHLQLHWPNHSIPLEETIADLESLKAAGKIRQFGVCNFGRQDLAAWIEKGGARTTNQVAYSLLARGIEDEIVPVMEAAGMKVLAYSPLMQGLLTGKFADADAVPPERARSRHFSGERPFSRHGQAGLESETFATIAQLVDAARRWGLALAPVALAWILRQPAVGAVIVGVRSRKQLERNQVATSLELAPAQVAELSGLTAGLKTAMGSEPDLWQIPSRMR